MARPATVHADHVGALLAAARDDSQRALDTLARARLAATARAPDPPFVFAPGPGLPARAIAAARFHSPCALRLAALELTLQGHCALRRYGWTGAVEAVFRLGRPPWWRRLLHPPPLLALRFSVQGGAAAVSVGIAGGRAGVAPSPGQDVRLAPALQAALLRLHREHAPARWFHKPFSP